MRIVGASMPVWSKASMWRREAAAHVGGYFWLPCPNCEQMFAGFEMSRNPHEVRGPDGKWVRDEDRLPNVCYKVPCEYCNGLSVVRVPRENTGPDEGKP